VTAARDDRLALGAAAVVRPTVAARWLGLDRRAGVAWLRALGLVRAIGVPTADGDVRLVERVVWGDVLDAVRGLDSAPAPRRAAPAPSLPWLDPER
jgi:hypothetical protein